MSATAASSHRLGARLTRWFFANFFHLLLIAVSVSQWVLLWWLFAPATGAPLLVHGLGVALIYGANRVLTRNRLRHSGRPRVERLPRFYYAAAFTSLFCALFLLLNGAVWLSSRLILGSIAAQASVGSGVAFSSGLDAVFRSLANLGILTVAATFVYGYSVGQRRLRTTRLRLPLLNAPAELHGLRIVQISDIHIGQNLDPSQLERFVTEVNALQPDLVCITGDIVDSPSAKLDVCLPLLARLQARHGVYAILGNHDHYAGADRVEAELRRCTGFTLLRDQAAEINFGGRKLHIIGLDDRGRDWARGVFEVPYLDAALARLPAEEPKLLLCHRPDVFPQASAGRIGLTLSGHTHGGQLAVPWFNGRYRNLAEFITKFDRGLYQRDECFLYVNSGLGVTGQRIRLCTPREITLIEVDVGSEARAAA